MGMKKCVWCHSYFTGDSPDSVCFFHPCPWLDVRMPNVVNEQNIGLWSCCQEILRTAKGCQSRVHQDESSLMKPRREFEIFAVKGTRHDALELLDSEFIKKHVGANVQMLTPINKYTPPPSPSLPYIRSAPSPVPSPFPSPVPSPSASPCSSASYSPSSSCTPSPSSSPSTRTVPIDSKPPKTYEKPEERPKGEPLVVAYSSRRSQYELPLRVYKRNKEDPEIPEGFVKYYIQRTDTLTGIALRYHVSIASLKKHNKLFSDNDMHKLKYLIIPPPTGGAFSREFAGPADMDTFTRAWHVTNFAFSTGVCPEEALFYLTDNGWDANLAADSLAKDIAWAEEELKKQRGKLKKWLGDTDVQTVAVVACGAIVVLLCIVL